jgi:small subunit ribosomal protein S17
MNDITRNKRKEYIGEVVSNKAERTITVAITYRKKDPRYGKFLKRTKKIMAHDQDNSCHTGDKVKIMETRPLSKNKHFRLVTILDKTTQI